MEFYYQIALAILWIILFLYIFFASIDFGIAFFVLHAKYRMKNLRLVEYLKGFLSPLWETSNMLFVFFIIGLIALYPSIAYYYSTAFFVPGCIAIIFFVVRAIYFVIIAKEREEAMEVNIPYALTGILIPICLSSGLIISEGGFILENEDQLTFLWMDFLRSPYTWSVWFYVIVSIMYISAMFLCTYAAHVKDENSFYFVRRFTLVWAAILVVANILVFHTLKLHSPTHFERLLDFKGLIVISMISYWISVFFVIRKTKLTFALIMTISYLFFAFFAYGISHLPAILSPYVMFNQIAPSREITIAAMIIFGAGIVLMIPSSIILIKKFKVKLENHWRV
ncbi:MAG: cytochrome d ubiquinol oxidase subunit II [Bacillaceae bacterium]